MSESLQRVHGSVIDILQFVDLRLRYLDVLRPDESARPSSTNSSEKRAHVAVVYSKLHPTWSRNCKSLIIEPLQLLTDDLFHTRRLVECRQQFLRQSLDLLVDGFTVVLDLGAPTYRPGVSA